MQVVLLSPSQRGVRGPWRFPLSIPILCHVGRASGSMFHGWLVCLALEYTVDEQTRTQVLVWLFVSQRSIGIMNVHTSLLYNILRTMKN